MRADAAANRERILEAAEEQFARHGAAASTETIARRAGVGAGTVFRHFPTKTDLLRAALLRHFERAEQVAARHTAAPYRPGGLAAALSEIARDGAAKAALAGVLLAESGSLGPAVPAAVDRLRDAVGRLLALAQAAGEVRADADIDVVYGMLGALGQAGERISPEVRARMLAVFLDGLRPGR